MYHGRWTHQGPNRTYPFIAMTALHLNPNTRIFYKHMEFSVEAFTEHKLCLKKITKAFMCLKIWPNPLRAYDVLKFKNPIE